MTEITLNCAVQCDNDNEDILFTCMYLPQVPAALWQPAGAAWIRSTTALWDYQCDNIRVPLRAAASLNTTVSLSPDHVAEHRSLITVTLRRSVRLKER